ncbi:uncharacterized protein IL334_002926 [Kwoniella shivajii]|uniref:Aminoglycoside phosphotransferase domain-containing protein n=1 Tax=Kwoniella shivajii TaxID=564305 RepID=A0ABZ1CXT0_9TREE|nr:hypothetical protein IL334_002926 [Kwoniella shivajii]
MYNGVNIHFPIIFDDGIKWLLRVRQSHNGNPPIGIQEVVIASEVTVLNILNNGGVPVPKAWLNPQHGDRTEESSAAGVGALQYFFYEFLPGPKLKVTRRGDDALWNPGTKIRKFIEDFAKIQIKMSNIPISANLIGCPVSPLGDNTKLIVGPLTSCRCLNMLDPPYFPGPFRTNQDRYLAQINTALSHIVNGHLCQKAPLDGYLWHLQLKELVQNCTELDKEFDQVFIRHADAKEDQFMGDEDGSISGVLDWEWAYVTTKEKAFSSPVFCFHHNKYFGSSMDLVPAEQLLVHAYERFGRSDLADCVRNGKIYQRLSHIGTFDQQICRQSAILKTFAKFKPEGFDPPNRVGEKWRLYLANRYHTDPCLPEMIARAGWESEKASC